MRRLMVGTDAAELMAQACAPAAPPAEPEFKRVPVAVRDIAVDYLTRDHIAVELRVDHEAFSRNVREMLIDGVDSQGYGSRLVPRGILGTLGG